MLCERLTSLEFGGAPASVWWLLGGLFRLLSPKQTKQQKDRSSLLFDPRLVLRSYLHVAIGKSVDGVRERSRGLKSGLGIAH